MKKRIICLLLAAVMAAMLLAGCAGKQGTDKDGRISISMYLWDKSMFKELSPWLEEQFPDIDFTFVQGFNTVEYYKDMVNRGQALPDIITLRRFSLNDMALLAPLLMDLSRTEVAGTFYSSYLDVNRETGGAIRWLPMCAEVDSIMANVDLFSQYNIPLPTNYAEFVAAIDAFEELGITGFQTDWSYDYTNLECMQGCAIPLLMGLEGTKWRMEYESETEAAQVGLDDVVWPQVFERFAQFLKDTRTEPGDESLSFESVTPAYRRGETAMIRATAAMAEIITAEDGVNSVILPYFGETSEDNWLLTYPMCQLAVSRQVEENPAKKEAVMKVLMAIFSEEGQKHNAAGATVLSYNKEVNITPSNSMRYVRDCIDSNHLYVRLASTEIFAISKDVGRKMIAGEYDARQAYEEFNRQITDYVNPEAETLFFTQKTAYSNDFGEHGSQAASSFVNTMRSLNQDQIAIGYGPICSSDIYAGDYTIQQVKWVMSHKTDVYRGEYTGAEIWQLMEALVNVREDGANPILHRNLMPVTGGMAYTVTETERGKFRLESITVDGKPLDDQAVYTVMLMGFDNFLEHPTFCCCPLPEDLKEKRQGQKMSYNNMEVVMEALAATGQFLEPDSYVTIRSGK